MIVVGGNSSTNPSFKSNKNLKIKQKNKKVGNEILIKDIFPEEVMMIGSYMYVWMQSRYPETQKYAILAWDRFEILINKSIKDSIALNRMINFLYQLQYLTLPIQPVDEKTVAMRIKQYM